MRIELYGIETIVARAILIKEIAELKAELHESEGNLHQCVINMQNASRTCTEKSQAVMIANFVCKQTRAAKKLDYELACAEARLASDTYRTVKARIEEIVEEIEFKTKSLSLI